MSLDAVQARFEREQLIARCDFVTASTPSARNKADATSVVKIAPLMTCFVPSLDHGTPFQISIHTWNKRVFTLLPPFVGSGLPQAWQIVVIVDGAVVW
jgi:hypothetical protein